MTNRGGLAVYVTSHGFGHLNRTVAVLNRIPADVPMVVRCHPNLFDRWSERLNRPARFEPHISDVGAVNPPGDSAATDGPATLALAERVHAEAAGRLDEEAGRLREEGTAAVLCDAPPLPLVAARMAGVPGFLLANFTWAEIYEPHARAIGPEALRFVESVRDAYRQASHVFRTQPCLGMERIAPTEDVGMVVNPGRDRRAELRARFGIPPGDKVVYFYVGRYGQEGLGWDRIAAMRGVHFVGFHPADGASPPNLHVVPAAEWNGADLAASADAMVAKAGYGTACEAMAAGTPFLYPPRDGFAEHQALDRALKRWGGGISVPARAFSAMKIEAALERAFAMTPGPPPFPIDGASRVAERLTSECRAGRQAP